MMTTTKALACALGMALLGSLAIGQGYLQQPIAWQQFLGVYNGAFPMSYVDATNDGLPDIVQTVGLSNAVACLPATGSGFGSPILSALVPSPPSANNVIILGSADVNADGNIDLVAYDVFGLRNWLGMGTGSFIPGPIVPQAPVANFALGDLDNDGMPELVDSFNGPVNAPPYSVRVFSILFGAWNPVATYVMPQQSGNVVIGDFNGDGWRDIAVFEGAPTTGANALVLVNSGNLGTLTLQGPFVHTPSVGVSLAADIDGDLCDDLVTMYPQTGTFVCSRGHPAQVLQPRVLSPLLQPFMSQLNCVRLTDVDSDGGLDLVVLLVRNALFGSPFFRADTYFYRGGGSFLLAGNLDLMPGDGGSFIPTDLDADGDNDLIVSRTRWDLPGPPEEIAMIQNRAILGQGVGGSFGVPVFSFGRPELGNSGFACSLSGALPSALAALGISLGTGFIGSAGAGLWLDVTPGQLLFPSGPLGIFLTNINGDATAPMAIPNVPSAAGLTFFSQWAVLDPGGAFSGVPGGPFALSEARTVILRQ